MAETVPRRTATLVSFDGTEQCEVAFHEPGSREALTAALRDHQRVAIRGSGLSYCQAGAADGSPSISTKAFDRVLDLDHGASTITVEAGCTIGALVRHAVDHGFWFPVIPGHPEITVGGCAAFNTHGKTQHDIGNFSDHIVSLTLLHPDHGETTCGPNERPDLFELTVGGMGLTGWIVDLTLRLQPLTGRSIRRRAHRAGDFVEAVEIMEQYDRPGIQLYSWNDASRTGASFGRGVVYEESFVDVDQRATTRFRPLRPERRGRLVPFRLWNRLSTPVVNTAYFQLEHRRRERTMPVLDAAFPINGKEGYFHAFGRRGFHEYQMIVPRPDWADAVERIRGIVGNRRACVTLASLKLFRGEPRHLWFRGDGVCLTLDGPADHRTRAMFADLDELAVDLGAPVNLSKDSRLDQSATSRIFSGYDEFAAALATHDPARRIDSALRRRIGV